MVFYGFLQWFELSGFQCGGVFGVAMFLRLRCRSLVLLVFFVGVPCGLQNASVPLRGMKVYRIVIYDEV